MTTNTERKNKRFDPYDPRTGATGGELEPNTVEDEAADDAEAVGTDGKELGG